jgi:c-di-GMP-related signal transduction protein
LIILFFLQCFINFPSFFLKNILVIFFYPNKIFYKIKMIVEPEHKLIESQFKLLSVDKRPKFSQLWNQFKVSMGEVKKYKLIIPFFRN